MRRLISTCVNSFLYTRSILYQRGFFETVTPVNFHTIATPHLGVPRLPNFISTVLSSWAPRLSRTGEQFYCVDKWGPTGKPLLQVMADPGVFMLLWLLPFSTSTRTHILSGSCLVSTHNDVCKCVSSVYSAFS